MVERKSLGLLLRVNHRVRQCLLMCTALSLLPLLPAHAELLEFDTIMEKALNNSYDVKISEVDTKLGEVDVLKAKIEYLPRVSLRMNSEHIGNLANNNTPNAIAVGDSILPSAVSRFQSFIGINLSQPIYQFGIAKHKLRLAQAGLKQREISEIKAERDLKIQVADAYATVLTNYINLKGKQFTLPLYQEVMQMKNRLYQSGMLSKVDVAESAIKVAETTDEIQILKQKFKDALIELSYFTHETYDPDSIEIAGFKVDPTIEEEPFDEQKTPEYKLYLLEVERRKEQLAAQERQALPQLNLYANYNMYGTDPSRLGGALRDIGPLTFTVGFSLNVPISDHIRNSAEVKRVKLETAKADLENLKRLNEIRRNYMKWKQESQERHLEMEHKNLLVNQNQEKLVMFEKLSQQEMLDKTRLLLQQAEVLDEKRRLAEADIRRKVSLMKMKLMTAV